MFFSNKVKLLTSLKSDGYMIIKGPVTLVRPTIVVEHNGKFLHDINTNVSKISTGNRFVVSNGIVLVYLSKVPKEISDLDYVLLTPINIFTISNRNLNINHLLPVDQDYVIYYNKYIHYQHGPAMVSGDTEYNYRYNILKSSLTRGKDKYLYEDELKIQVSSQNNLLCEIIKGTKTFIGYWAAYCKPGQSSDPSPVPSPVPYPGTSSDPSSDPPPVPLASLPPPVPYPSPRPRCIMIAKETLIVFNQDGSILKTMTKTCEGLYTVNESGKEYNYILPDIIQTKTSLKIFSNNLLVFDFNCN